MKFQVFMVTVFLAALVLVQAELYKNMKLTEKEFQRSLIDKLSKTQKQKQVNEIDIMVCTETCSYNDDGECDDGGAGSDYDVCRLGTDCKDCGSRSYDDTVCSETCEYSGDGECDDGGDGSDYDSCGLGTDCEDCGSRYVCSEICLYSDDGECDDGGAGSLDSLCALGTDCEDCGSRNNE
ncbi:uncharacterized protein LOC144438865 isoform X2 [Glandiceps talaboti]